MTGYSNSRADSFAHHRARILYILFILSKSAYRVSSYDVRAFLVRRAALCAPRRGVIYSYYLTWDGLLSQPRAAAPERSTPTMPANPSTAQLMAMLGRLSKEELEQLAFLYFRPVFESWGDGAST